MYEVANGNLVMPTTKCEVRFLFRHVGLCWSATVSGNWSALFEVRETSKPLPMYVANYVEYNLRHWIVIEKSRVADHAITRPGPIIAISMYTLRLARRQFLARVTLPPLSIFRAFGQTYDSSTYSSRVPCATWFYSECVWATDCTTAQSRTRSLAKSPCVRRLDI